MAAPDETSWSRDYVSSGNGRIGIYLTSSSTETKTTVNAEIWFWTKYSCIDSSNIFYANWASTATTSIGSRNINTSSNTGGWSKTNQVKIGNYSKEYDRGTSNSTEYFSAKFENVEHGGGSGTHTVSFTIPARNKYTVTYNANGGTGSMSNSTATYGANFITRKNEFTRSGYTFNGWAYIAPDGSIINWNLTDNGVYESGKSFIWYYNYNITLYAQWVKNEYNITFNGNGGLVDGNETITYEKKYNVDFPLSNITPTRYGYRFKYWLAKQEDVALQINNGILINIDNQNIPRIWMKRLNSGTTGWEILVYAPTSSTFSVPTWTNLNGQDDIIWHKLGSGNWERSYNGENYTFNFGTQIYIKDHNNELTNYISHFYGYDSSGNLKVQDGSSLPTYSVEFYSENLFSHNQDVIFYAQWRANSYDINLDLNGGKINENSSPIILEQTLIFNESYMSSLSDYIPTRAFYEFNGFYDADGIKVYDKDGKAVPCKYFDTTNNTYIYDGDLILYAHWKPLNLAHYKLDGKWVLCNSYIKDNSIWKPAIFYKNTDEDYISDSSVLTDEDTTNT